MILGAGWQRTTRAISERTRTAVGRPNTEQQLFREDFRCHCAPGGQCFLVAELKVDSAQHARASRLVRGGRKCLVLARRTVRR